MITSASIILTILLIALLVPRVLLNGLDGTTAARARLGLNVALVPLTVMFLANVISVVTQSNIGEPPVAIGSPASPTTVVVPTINPMASPEPETERLIADDFSNPASGWIERTTKTWKTDYVDDSYLVELTGRPAYSVTTPLPTENYQLGIDVNVTQGAAGVVFLSSEPDVFYRLLIRNDGAYTIQSASQANTAIMPIVDWTISDAVLLSGAMNRLRVDRQGNTIRFFANNQPLTVFTIPSGQYQNVYGFALLGTNGQAQAFYDNLVIERRIR